MTIRDTLEDYKNKTAEFIKTKVKKKLKKLRNNKGIIHMNIRDILTIEMR